MNLNAYKLIIYFILALCLFGVITYQQAVAQEKKHNFESEKEEEGKTKNVWSSEKSKPEIINDSNLKIELVAQGLEFPTSMAFNGPDDILILEKEKGTVRRIVDGRLVPEALLKIDVGMPNQTCMCGIAISRTNPDRIYVFLYFTETLARNQQEGRSSDLSLSNSLYRYELDKDKLHNPKELLNLPPTAGPHHTGGAIIIGPDNNVYVPVGDLDNIENREYFNTLAQNFYNSKGADGRSGILRITQDGNPVGKGILGKEYPLNLYYAYGIRNSFGMDFDPVTGNLWDTENGPAFGDEINLVEPGFNSGWAKVQGIWKPFYDQERGVDFVAGQVITNISTDDLVTFDGKGKYSAPEFIWKQSTGPTALTFLHSENLGKKYENDIFVGSVSSGQIYHFDLNKDRTELVLPAQLRDKIADTDQEIDQSGILFGRGFGGITDIEVGPDGYLYIVSIGEGKIFRILSSGNIPQD